jgi:hypothetical protein
MLQNNANSTHNQQQNAVNKAKELVGLRKQILLYFVAIALSFP